MVFSSIIFLWVLLPCILLLYYVSPKPFKNGILTVFSLFFYAWGEPRYVVLMIFSVLLNYGFGRLVEKFGKKRWLLALCVTLNLLILGYFKYYNFLAEVLNPLLRGFDIALPAIQVTLPIGISFYTFQALSYVVDVYRGENQAQKNPLNMMLYISFFPQLIAGPIVKYHDIEEQIENRTVTLEGFFLRRETLYFRSGKEGHPGKYLCRGGGRGLRVSGGGCEPGDALADGASLYAADLFRFFWLFGHGDWAWKNVWLYIY